MATKNGRPRYFPNDGIIKPFDVSSDIAKQLDVLVTLYPPSPETFLGQDQDDLMGLYSGPTSIAYGLFLISKRLDTPVQGRSLSDWADLYLDTSAQVVTRSTATMFRLPIDASTCGILHEIACNLAVKAGIRFVPMLPRTNKLMKSGSTAEQVFCTFSVS
jgi:hypothetical protein